MYGSLDVSISALVAYRTQLDVVAGNIATKDAYHHDAEGNPAPYRRRVALFASGNPSKGDEAPGVHIAKIVNDPTPFSLRWDPDHVNSLKTGPQKGYVRISNVDYQTEMVNAITAARAYEANVTVMEMAKRMSSTTLRLIA